MPKYNKKITEDMGSYQKITKQNEFSKTIQEISKEKVKKRNVLIYDKQVVLLSVTVTDDLTDLWDYLSDLQVFTKVYFKVQFSNLELKILRF